MFPLNEAESRDKEEEEDEVELKVLKNNDPVRLYLKKMGSVSLLDRDGEVEIARRIEKGEREIIRAILMCPAGTVEIIRLGDHLKNGRLKVKSIFRGLEDEEHRYNEKEYVDKIFELIGHVKKYQKSSEASFQDIRDKKASSQESEEVLVKMSNELMKRFKNINFNRKIINRIIIKFHNLLNRMEELQKRVKSSVEKTFSPDFSNLKETYLTMYNSNKESLRVQQDTGLSFKEFRDFYLSSEDAIRRLDRLYKDTWMDHGWVKKYLYINMERRKGS